MPDVECWSGECRGDSRCTSKATREASINFAGSSSDTKYHIRDCSIPGNLGLQSRQNKKENVDGRAFSKELLLDSFSGRILFTTQELFWKKRDFLLPEKNEDRENRQKKELM